MFIEYQPDHARTIFVHTRDYPIFLDYHPQYIKDNGTIKVDSSKFIFEFKINNKIAAIIYFEYNFLSQNFFIQIT